MLTFYNLIQTIMKCNIRVYPLYNKFLYNENVKCDVKYKQIILIVYNIINTISYEINYNFNCNINFISKIKFKILNNIQHNIFLSCRDADILQELITLTQKHYRALSRFAYIVKYKQKNTIVTTDLKMNTLIANHVNYNNIIAI